MLGSLVGGARAGGAVIVRSARNHKAVAGPIAAITVIGIIAIASPVAPRPDDVAQATPTMASSAKLPAPTASPTVLPTNRPAATPSPASASLPRSSERPTTATLWIPDFLTGGSPTLALYGTLDLPTGWIARGDGAVTGARPGDHLRLLLLDVDGLGVVVNARDRPEHSAADRAAIEAIIESLSLTRT